MTTTMMMMVMMGKAIKLSRCYCGASYPVAQSCGSDLRADRFWDTFPWEPPHQLVVLNLPQLPT